MEIILMGYRILYILKKETLCERNVEGVAVSTLPSHMLKDAIGFIYTHVEVRIERVNFVCACTFRHFAYGMFPLLKKVSYSHAPAK
jgi:hypothetical protein